MRETQPQTERQAPSIETDEDRLMLRALLEIDTALKPFDADKRARILKTLLIIYGIEQL